MPRVTLPPTPVSSTEITSEKDPRHPSLEMSFLLPPPAMVAANGKRSTTNSVQSQSKITSADFSLPPPPTRSRKIIQMKPQPKQMDRAKSPPSPRPTPKSTSKKGTSGSSAAGKKQPSSTSAAGKKMARKTAHSVIERRRRSKMNEEFGVLKEMIPACKDQDMHKLAILQASIDYLRYLEQCIANLQAANTSMANTPAQPQALPPLVTSISPVDNEREDSDDDDDEEEDDQDQEMGNTESVATTPVFSAMDYHTSTYQSPQSNHTSPTLDAVPPRPPSSYASSSVSTLPSPAYGPQQTPCQGHRFDYSTSTSTSPMLLPDPKHPDHEATTALLMLNQDRRHPNSGRGMSVKDLLTS
ncbi:hypothetical protein MMC07_004637 [Pseudocyphellaria aurata]|nr:hypothetical protein [Pseudocyphellaria aurata]